MLGIVQYGIVKVSEDGAAYIVRPMKNGGAPQIVAVPDVIAQTYRLATGDIVAGDTAVLASESHQLEANDCQLLPIEEDVDLQYDEPIGSCGTLADGAGLSAHASETLIFVVSVNGIDAAQADDRPYAKTRRSQSERTKPDRLLNAACGHGDLTGRLLDFSAMLTAGDVGAIVGQHGSGLSRTVRSLLQGISTNSPDCIIIAMVTQARGEEVTDLRRRFPDIDIVICPTTSFELSAQDALILPNLILEAAQRHTERGKDVVLLIDSLTGLWGMMLDAEQAVDQHTADISGARQRVREFVQKAGCFHGADPLGGSLGGSLTIVGTVWSQPIDEDAEMDKETHPHLRLFESIVSDLSWSVTLDGHLANQRLYPAIDVKCCLSRNEGGLLPAELETLVYTARGSLPRNEPGACYVTVMNAMERTDTLEEMCRAILE